MLYECARNNPRAANSVGLLAALYLHLGPFSRFVISMVERQIAMRFRAMAIAAYRPASTCGASYGTATRPYRANQRRFSVAVEGGFGAEPEEAASGRSFR